MLTVSQTLLDSTVAALRVDTSGPSGNLICLHGFTQNRFALVAHLTPLLRAHYRHIWFLDCPGHGASASIELPRFFASLASIGDSVDLVGYSMGARLGLWLIAEYPNLVKRAVIVSGHLGLVTDEERARRQASDDVLAGRLRALTFHAGLRHHNGSYRDFLIQWNQAPLFGGRQLRETDLALRMLNNPAGLAWALETYGTGHQPNLEILLSQANTRMLYLYGEHDDAYRAMANRASALNSFDIAQVSDAAHDVFAQQPECAGELTAHFLRHTDE